MEELRLLAPRTLIVLGDWPMERLRTLRRAGAWQHTRELDRGWIELDGNRVEILGCYHPGYRGWRRSYRALVTSLRETPLR
jgi:uracil-DNA glycosylase